jgi:septum site-determining protein MinC
MVANKKIDFKGTKDGFIIHISGFGPFEELIEAIKVKLEGSGSFFKSAEIVGVDGYSFNIREKKMLKHVIEKQYGLSVVSLETVSKVSVTSTPKPKKAP